MKPVGQCINCGVNLVEQARVWSLAKMSRRMDSVGGLAKNFLWVEAPVEAARIESGHSQPPGDFRCPSCGVVYPAELWGELAFGLSLVSGMAMMSSRGARESEEMNRRVHEIEGICRKLRVCENCKTVYKGGFFGGKCPRC